MRALRKTVSVLTVGDEILSGEIHDTNFDYIADRLNSIGIEIARSVSCPDDVGSISKCINQLLEVSDAVLITGGLGPTSDDLTREGISEALGLKLIKNEDLELYLVDLFQKFGRKIPARNIKQAYVPEGAGIIDHAGGTAAGISLEHQGKLIIAITGVPAEMVQMFESYVIEALNRITAGGAFIRTERLNVFGVGESDVEERLEDLIRESVVRYGFLAKGGQVTIKLTAEANSSREIDDILKAEKDRVYRILGHNIFSEGDVRIEEVISKLLTDCGKSIAVAESLTAGMVCERIANVPGSSNYLLGGVVSYSTESKKSVLGIPGEAVAGGSVNESVAREMAVSVRELFSSDIGLSTTGLAGPGRGGENETVGTVCVGLAHSEGAASFKRRIPGGRSYVRTAASALALNVLRLFLEDPLNRDPFH